MNAFDAERPFNAPRSWSGRAAFAAIAWLERLVRRQSSVGIGPFFEPDRFEWAAELQANWAALQAEALRLVACRDSLPAFQEISREVGFITRDRNWKTFVFMGYGVRCERNLDECPATAAALGRIRGLRTALISILEPGKRLPLHRGPYNGVLRVHLGLVVPDARDRCWIRVGGERRTWSPGELLVFDDALPHEVHNDTDQVRVVLFLDVLRPCRWPSNWLNRAFVCLARFSPLVGRARRNQADWERRFYGGRSDASAGVAHRSLAGSVGEGAQRRLARPSRIHSEDR